MSRVLYLNHILSNDTPGYGNISNVKITNSRSIQNGDTSNESFIELGNHIGTHLDAPYHFDKNGVTLDKMNPEFWICSNIYLIHLHLEPKEICTLQRIQPYIEDMPVETEVLLIKTDFERFRTESEIYGNENPILAPEIAIYLRTNYHLRFVGIDTISFGSRSHREMGRETHKAFLNKENFPNEPIFLIEDMHLYDLKNNPKLVTISPLLFRNADGSPCTILAQI